MTSGRRKPSRFDRVTPLERPINAVKVPMYVHIRVFWILSNLTFRPKEEWRQSFERGVAVIESIEEMKAQQMEFDQLQADVVVMPEPDAIPYPDQPPVDRHRLVDTVMQYYRFVHWLIFGFQDEKPANLVYDKSGKLMWQDPTTQSLVYAASDEQMAAIASGDWSIVPIFKYSPDNATINQVQSKSSDSDPTTTTTPSSSLMVAVSPIAAISSSTVSNPLKAAAQQQIAVLEKVCIVYNYYLYIVYFCSS
jgi:hypothetical protein